MDAVRMVTVRFEHPDAPGLYECEDKAAMCEPCASFHEAKAAASK
jgi:hypothetical protein